MEIREAIDSDIPDIIALLKVSLGESLMPKSERYWRWKHIENPFGRSPVLLCWDGTKLVGVRAFMRWQWIGGGKLYKAVRAVDTATHPEYQGKGIFKKLTLALVDSCTKAGDHFVFNTPNTQSKPGYLKMGWAAAGRLVVNVNVYKPIQLLKNLVATSGPESRDTESDLLKESLAQQCIVSLTERHGAQTNGLTTNVSPAYLKWRYVDVPVARYIGISEKPGDEESGLVIGRIKQTRLGRELRITDMFLKKKPGKVLIQTLKECIRSYDIDYCTVSGTSSHYGKHLFGPLSITAALGPIVTVRSLEMQDLTPLKRFQNWSPSLGDLELF